VLVELVTVDSVVVVIEIDVTTVAAVVALPAVVVEEASEPVTEGGLVVAVPPLHATSSASRANKVRRIDGKLPRPTTFPELTIFQHELALATRNPFPTPMKKVLMAVLVVGLVALIIKYMLDEA
jgi:hypothetical protein